MDELIQAMQIVKVGRHQISFSPFSSGVFIRENWFHGIERSSFKRVDVCYRRKKWTMLCGTVDPVILHAAQPVSGERAAC